MFRTRNAIFSNKVNVKSSFKEFSFAEGDEQYVNNNLPRHNRLEGPPRNELRAESRQLEPRIKRKSPENGVPRKDRSSDEAVARKIEQTIYPMLYQRSLNQPRENAREYREISSEVLETNYPFYYLRKEEREKSPIMAERTEPNRIFSVSRRLKNPGIINFDKFHRRQQMDRSRDETLSKGWRSNMVRYGRQDFTGWTEQE